MKNKIFVPYDLKQGEKDILKKKKNLIVIMAVKRLNKVELNREAKKQNCRYYYLNNKILEVN